MFFVRIFLIALMTTFAITAHAKSNSRKPSRIDPGLQIMVVVQRGSKPRQWASSLPAGARIIRQYHPFYLIRLVRPITKSEIERLRKHPVVKRLNQDRLVNPASAYGRSARCIQTAQANNIDDIQALIDQSGVDCDLFHSCSSDGRAALQAQLAVGGDLMLEAMKDLGVSDGHTSVAILDSGFNSNLMQYMNRPPTVAFDISAQAGGGLNHHEEFPHGSAVAGLLGAKNGVGLAPGADLSIYKVDINENGDSSATLVEIQALAACRAGQKIINVSYQRIYTERDSPEVVSELAANGCIVVNAAGNDPGTALRDSNNDDAWVRVGGVNVESGANAPLELGEVNAPGFDVATLDPSIDSRCDGQPMRQQFGTSMSAPIVSAILANVRGVLARDPKFGQQSGPDQVALMNRILRGSTRGGMVNGLRAVMIADAWTKVTGAKPSSETALSNLLVRYPPAKCAEPLPSTDLRNLSCSERKASVADLRYRAAVCPDFSEEDLTKFIRGLASVGESGVGLNLSHYLFSGGAELRRELGFAERADAPGPLEAERIALEAANTAAMAEVLRLQGMQVRQVPGTVTSAWNSALANQLAQLESARQDSLRLRARLRQDPVTNAEHLRFVEMGLANLTGMSNCVSQWRRSLAGVRGRVLGAAEFHSFVQQTRQSAGAICDSSVAYLPSPYNELASHALTGGTYSEYSSALTVEITNAQLRAFGIE